MQINSDDLPVIIQSTQIGESYAVEARGIWEMEGDFLGGPFLSYHILDETTNEIVNIFGFVLAPGERKRNFMLYLDHIIQSFELRSNLN